MRKNEVIPDYNKKSNSLELKSNRKMVLLRLNEVIDLLRKGTSRAKCTEFLMNKYGLSEKQSRKYLHDAFTKIYEASNIINPEELKMLYIDRIESLMNQAIEGNRLQIAAKLQDMLNKMNGMYVDKQEINVTSDNIKFKFDS